MILLAIMVSIIWISEIVFLCCQFYKAYREDVKRYGKDIARKMWTGRR